MSQFQPGSITALIDDYGLNTEKIQTEKIVAAWLQQYEAAWIVKAIVEAVFRGRYQIKSVDDILKQWQRLGKPRCSFKPDFERERLRKFADFTELAKPTTAPTDSQPIARSTTKGLNSQLPIGLAAPIYQPQTLNPEELEPFHHHCRSIGTSLPCHHQPAPSHSPVDNLHHPAPQTFASTNNQIARNIPLPPRWWLLDKLKIAIASVEIDNPVVLAEAETAATKCDKTDGHPFGRQPQPEEQSQRHNNAH
jgi:hypothetical protein